MLARLENYILDVMRRVNGCYPGLVYTWDVVNEAIEPDQGGPGLYRTRSPWFRITGQDFLPAAFRAARRGAAPGQTLCYNDYNAFDPVKRDAIIGVLKTLQAENLVDTMGMQGHYVLPFLNVAACESAARAYAALGLKLRVSELDVGVSKNTEEDFQKQAKKYADVKKLMLEYADQTEAVEVWGLTDNMSYRSYEYPLLFDASCNPKPAFWAVVNPDGEGSW
jgi:endo-1,4-beta-xylanase